MFAALVRQKNGVRESSKMVVFGYSPVISSEHVNCSVSWGNRVNCTHGAGFDYVTNTEAMFVHNRRPCVVSSRRFVVCSTEVGSVISERSPISIRSRPTLLNETHACFQRRVCLENTSWTATRDYSKQVVSPVAYYALLVTWIVVSLSMFAAATGAPRKKAQKGLVR